MIWTDKGIYATAYQKTIRPLFLMNPDNGRVERVLDYPPRIYGLSISKDGNTMAYAGEEDEGYPVGE